MADDSRLDLEFAYTSYRDSCRDPLALSYLCRRPVGHHGEHAAGFGPARVRWAESGELDAPVPTR